MATLWTGSSIPFEEYPNSPMVKGNQKTRSATRRGKVNWADVDAIYAEALPSAPFLPALFPGSNYLYVDSVDIQPLGASVTGHVGTCEENNDGINAPQFGEITVTYKPLPYDSTDRRALTLNFGVELMTIPSSSLYWGNGDKIQRLDLVANIRVPTTEISDTYNKIPASSYQALLSAVRSNIGKVNSNNFNGAVPETLLFTGTQITFDFDGLGAKTYTASHRFSERNPENLGYGWNHVIDGDTGTWRKVYFDQGTTIPMYQTSNSFGMLFP